MIAVQCSLDLPSLNRVGPQGGGPTPAPCAKYCPTGKPPTSFGLNEPARFASMLKRAFRGRPARSLYPLSSSAIFLIALNIKSQFKTLFLGFDVKSTFELPSEERRQGKRAGRPF
ncbi:hypothetical protein CU280_20330 [Yersinia mollaretii]|nr:hypothetical protein CU280_20330 [Yersinia mollaretii]